MRKLKFSMIIIVASVVLVSVGYFAQALVQNTGTLTIGTETNSVGGQNWHYQWVTQMYKFIDFGASATGDAQGTNTTNVFSSYINCTRMTKIVIHAEGSASNTAISVRLIFNHHNATRADTYTDSKTLINTGIQESTNAEALNASYFHFVGEVMDVMPGAKEFKIHIISIANGTGKVYARGV